MVSDTETLQGGRLGSISRMWPPPSTARTVNTSVLEALRVHQPLYSPYLASGPGTALTVGGCAVPDPILGRIPG